MNSNNSTFYALNMEKITAYWVGDIEKNTYLRQRYEIYYIDTHKKTNDIGADYLLPNEESFFHIIAEARRWEIKRLSMRDLSLNVFIPFFFFWEWGVEAIHANNEGGERRGQKNMWRVTSDSLAILVVWPSDFSL